MGVFREYFLNSSLHGLHFIADIRYHWTERFFWIICVLTSWICCMLLSASAISQYQKQEISISVDTSYLHWKTNFPSIVICEKFNEKKISEANKKLFGTLEDVLPSLEQFVFYDGTLTNKKSCEIGNNFREKCILRNYSGYMHQFRSTCSEAIGSCYYNNEQFPCCEEFFKIETYWGPCFAFNSLLSGKYRKPEDLPFKISRNTDSGIGNLSLQLFHNGFIIYGLSHDAVPTKDTSAEFELLGSLDDIEINTYYKLYLSVKPTYADEDARLINIKNRGCRYYDENNLQYSKIYSLSTCENECFVEAQKRYCNCSVHTLPHNKKVKECDFEGILCTIDNEDIAECIKSCTCTSSCFDMEVNNMGFTRTSAKKFIDTRSVARIDFLVLPPTIRYSRSLVKTPLSMLVTVGGIASLFFGASLLSVIEIIYYFLIRPLGDRYLTKIRDDQIRDVKQKNMDFYKHHFQYVN